MSAGNGTEREAGGVRRCKNGRRLGGSRNCGGAGAAAARHPFRSRLSQPTLAPSPEKKAGKRPEEVGWPRADAPGPPRAFCPAGCPHLAKESPESLAVELHLQPGPRGRYRDPSPRISFRTFPGRRLPRTKLPERS